MVIPLAVFVLEAVGLFSSGQKKLMFYPEFEFTSYSNLSFITKIQTKLILWNKVICC